MLDAPWHNPAGMLTGRMLGAYRDYSLLERDPILVKLDPDPRFRDIVDRMRKDVEVQRSRARQGGLLDIDALLASPNPGPGERAR
jgi:hypothetical protein